MPAGRPAAAIALPAAATHHRASMALQRHPRLMRRPCYSAGLQPRPRPWQSQARRVRIRSMASSGERSVASKRAAPSGLPVERIRCGWVPAGDQEYARYHDEEWGRPVQDDDRHLFEMLTLEGAQAGLSWSTILRKRAAYRKAFADFDPAKVARF